MSVFDQVNYTNDQLLETYKAIEEKGGVTPEDKNMKNLPSAVKTIEKEVEGDADFFGCEDGEKELTYLENIMPDLLTLEYGGFLRWV